MRNLGSFAIGREVSCEVPFFRKDRDLFMHGTLPVRIRQSFIERVKFMQGGERFLRKKAIN